MALTESTMIEIGSTAPDFTLPDTVSGRDLSISDLKGTKGTLILFLCNHCPYVIHVNHELVAIANTYSNFGISTVAISSNDVIKYPQDSPDKMNIVAKVLQYPFPYLYDEDQSVARAYEAACTPDIYLYDTDLSLVYRGRLDGSRPGNDVVLDGKDLRHAIDNLLAGGTPLEKQYPSAGCNIKWKS
jgi:peroxiredoxin